MTGAGSIEVVVGGEWLTTIASWGELAWSHGADGGCLEASWKMDLPPTFTHRALRSGKIVQVKAGPSNQWAGIMSEPDADDDWTLTARGLHTLAADYLCLDPLGNTTSTPDVAIDRAIAAGLPWKRPNSLSNVPFAATGATDDLNFLKALLDAWSTSQGLRWGVNAKMEVYAAADPTTPKWHLTPGSGRLGLADEEYVSDLFLRYLKSATGYATATVSDVDARDKFGRREQPVDLTGQGVITPASATATGVGMIAKGAARQGYTNGIEPSSWQLTTPGGKPASLRLVRGQQVVRLFGVRSEQGQPTNFIDWPIGETHLEAGAETIGLTPVGLVPRTLGDVLSVTGDAA